MSNDSTRLNKLLAEQLGISRREADDYISSGKALVNGAPAELGARITRGVDLVTFNSKPLATAPVNFIYLLLNKPPGYVSSRRQQGEFPTIYELLPKEYHHLKPVGRLDKDSSGLLLLTNDGDFAHRMTHPSFEKRKVYEVTLNKTLNSEDKKNIEQGIEVENYTSKLHLKHLQDTSWQVIMHQGRNRQIRRTFAALGYEVIDLHRTKFGDFSLDSLAPGDFTLKMI